jgi:hypothetical protein
LNVIYGRSNLLIRGYLISRLGSALRGCIFKRIDVDVVKLPDGRAKVEIRCANRRPPSGVISGESVTLRGAGRLSPGKSAI